MRRSGYRLRFGSAARALLNYVTYLTTIPGGIAGGATPPNPSRFEAGDWTAVAGDPGEIVVEVLTLPSGQPITRIDFRVDAGDWVDSEIVEPGEFIIEGLDSAVEYEIELRGFGEGGAGDASDIKIVETT